VLGFEPAGVYFVQAGDDGPIKIGVARASIPARLKSLQTGNPAPLRLLGYLPHESCDALLVRWRQDGIRSGAIAWAHQSRVSVEVVLHGMFAEGRLEGEWFEPTPELLSFIEAYAAARCRRINPYPPGYHSRGTSWS
jgi:hypothetical protein